MAVLSANCLKLLAAAAMALDHAGLMLFPGAVWMRLLGRLAFPIFAFMIAEGCKFTRRRGRYVGTIALLAAVCQTVYFLFDGSLYLSVLVTFTLSILTIYTLDAVKARPGLPAFCGLGLALLGVWWLNRVFTMDYGFWGCLVPVFASLPVHTRWDTIPCRVLSMGAGLLLLAIASGGIQYWSLLALPLLLCYSGKRGKWKMKYFFYIFYPAHLVILQGIQMLLG